LSTCGAGEARFDGAGRAFAHLVRGAVSVFAALMLAPPAFSQWTPAAPLSEARSAHSATLLTDGRVLVAGGRSLTNAFIGITAQVYSPATDTWAPTPNMSLSASAPRAVRLADGRVLVTDSSTLAGVYDPATNTWSPTGSMSQIRGMNYRMVALADGRAIVIGSSGCGTGAEIWSPSTGAWTSAGTISAGGCDHTATLLVNGKVLVAGGRAAGVTPFARSELYDPATNTWAPAGAMGTGRRDHEATLLPDGRVLVSGGWAPTGSGNQISATAELYDPTTNTWAPTGSMHTTRTDHELTLLTGGKVLATGAAGDAGFRVELYDPATGCWRREPGMSVERLFHGSTLLGDGRVLVTGGQGTTGYRASAEIYEPPTVTWAPARPLAAARLTHSAVRLASGRVLAIGATNGMLPRAEVYDPTADAWSPAGAMAVDRSAFDAALLADGRVLVAGGFSGSNLASTELYDPGGNSWSNAAPLSVPRNGLTLTRLPDGKVLAAGGSDIVAGEDAQFKSTELYDPAAGTWAPAAEMAVKRTEHTALLLENGRVLVVGGANSDGAGPLQSTELYDAETNTWVSAGNLPGGGRNALATAKLADGRVLVVGGCRPCNSTFVIARDNADIYDPVTNTWSPAAPLRDARWFATATLLENGRVLVSGGLDSDRATLWSTEVYNPATNTWTRGPALQDPRYGHSATLVANGVVLLAGGANYDDMTVLRSSERAKPPCTMLGTESDDVLAGKTGADVLCGIGRNDQIAGNDGDDALEGGPGDDSLSGGPGADTLTGDGGLDIFAGGDGDDVLRARDGVGESIACGAGVDVAVVDSFDVALSDCETIDVPDTTAPETTIASGPSGPTAERSATFTFTASEPGTTFRCRLDAGGPEPCASPKTYADLTEGAHSFEVTGTDAAGNADASPATRAWTVDETAPDTTITFQPPTRTSNRTVSVAFVSSEPGSSFECSLDGAQFSPCASPLALSGLAVRAHTFEVRATDVAGNRDVSPAVARWTVTPRCITPRLRGKTLAQARTTLDNANCTLGRVTRAYSDKVRRGKIVRQSPVAGRSLPNRARVKVVVSGGRRP
jgi:Ca2+-binding RTX toxin-like protein